MNADPPRQCASADTLAERRVPIPSSIYCALSKVVLERLSYSYQLLKRLESEYGELLSFCGPAQVYTALNALEGGALIEEVPATWNAPRRRCERQPRRHYQATADGGRGLGARRVLEGRAEERRQ